MRIAFRSVLSRPTQIDATAFLARATHVVSSSHGDDTVLLDTARGQYYSLAGVGARIWELLGTGSTATVIVRTIHAEYSLPADAAPDLVERDVHGLLSSLCKRGLVVILPVAPGRSPTS
jgi:hypothetical protein